MPRAARLGRKYRVGNRCSACIGILSVSVLLAAYDTVAGVGHGDAALVKTPTGDCPE
jgi:hypothetical protein